MIQVTSLVGETPPWKGKHHWITKSIIGNQDHCMLRKSLHCAVRYKTDVSEITFLTLKIKVKDENQDRK